MNENLKYIVGAVAVVGLSIGAVVYLSRKDGTAPPVEPPAAALPAPAAMPEEPEVRHPLPEPEAREPLPALAESDVPVQGALMGMLGKEPVEQFLKPENLVRHMVVTIDNLPEQKVAERLRPVRRVPGTFAVAGSEDEPTLDPANFARYQPLVQMFRSTDNKVLLANYQRYYPLFQEAYESLGHPPQYFNDRLVEVIDHLLATPDVSGAIALAQPGVLYEYADPKLEALSAGQKALIRMGSENASAVKDKLRELRGELLALSAAPKTP